MNQAPYDLTDFVLATELAASRSVTIHAVYNWLKRQGKHRKPFFFVFNKKGYIRGDIAALYSESRASERPRGCKTVKSVLAELPYHSTSGYHFLRKLGQRGEITILTYRGSGYLSESDANHFLRQWCELLPLPGWVPLQETAKRAQVTPAALSTWAKRNGVELRFYRHTEHFYPVHFLEEKHARFYIEQTNPRRTNARVSLQEAA